MTGLITAQIAFMVLCLLVGYGIGRIDEREKQELL